jgi:WD40 repeat protein
MSNNNVILDLATHFYRADNLAWSPAGEKIATVDAEGTIRIWNASGGGLLQTFIHISNPNSIVWSPDGSKIAVLYDAATIKVYDVSTKQEYVQPEGMLTANDEILWVGDRILLLNRDARIQSWNIQSGETEMLINPRFGRANLISLSHNGDKLAYVEQGGNVLIVDVKSGEILFNVNTKITDYVRDIAYSWNNQLIAIASNRKVILVNVETGEIKAIMEDRAYGSFTSLSWPVSENQLLIGTGDGKILIWDIETTKVINLLEMYETSILDLATSQNGYKLAAIGVRGEIYIWNTDDWNRESILQGSNEYLVVADLEFTPDGNHLASFGLLWETLYDGARYQLWDLNANELFIEWFGDPGFLLATSISFSPDGSFLASSYGEIWDPFTGELLQRFKFDSAASDIVWTPDNKNVIITGDLVEFWGINP